MAAGTEGTTILMDEGYIHILIAWGDIDNHGQGYIKATANLWLRVHPYSWLMVH